MENIYHKLLGISKNIEVPSYYQILNLTKNSFSVLLLEEKYRDQLQKLQRIGKNPKYKEAILFLKSELRKARVCLENKDSKEKYDLWLKEKAMDEVRAKVDLFAVKGYIEPSEENHLKNFASKHQLSFANIHQMIKDKNLPYKNVNNPFKNKGVLKEFYYLVCILALLLYYNNHYIFYYTEFFYPEKTSALVKTEIAVPVDKNKKETKKNIIKFPENIPLDAMYIPSGDFYMGTNEGDENERPLRRVYLDSFYISNHEVTNQEYWEFVKDTNYPVPYSDSSLDQNFKWNPIEKTFPEGKEDYPVTLVSWNDANNYCKWLSKKLNLDVSLPTEAQWEKAARGEAELAQYPWGPFEIKIKNNYYANYAAGVDKNLDGFRETSPVFSFKVGCSPFGCYNMSGNVREWCLDNYHSEAYKLLDSNNPLYDDKSERRVLRGGSWGDDLNSLRVSYRFHDSEKERSIYNGFRYVISLNDKH